MPAVKVFVAAIVISSAKIVIGPATSILPDKIMSFDPEEIVRLVGSVVLPIAPDWVQFPAAVTSRV